MLLNYLEKIAVWVSNQSKFISIALYIITVAVLFMDWSFHYTVHQSTRVILRIGKNLGNIALYTMLLALSYYLIRECYLRLQKQKNKRTILFNLEFKHILLIVRHIHPVVGVLLVNLVFLHAYIMLFYAKYGLALYSGIAAFIFLIVITCLGWAIRSEYYKKEKISIMKKHRMVAIAGTIVVFIHKIIS